MAGKSIWPKASPLRVAKALEAHSALALAFSGLIYLLCISGVLSVFNHELQRWEQPRIEEMATISPSAIQTVSDAVLVKEGAETSHFYIQMPTWDMPRTVVSTDTQTLFANSDGTIGEVENHPWTQFILDLHYYLHLPHTAGLIVVGILGVMLLALGISGMLAHPRVFRDAFQFRIGRNERLTQADLHNRLSVWTSPFLIASALSGAVLGLAGLISMSVATADYEGDVFAVYGAVFGEEPEENDAPAPLANIAAGIEYVSTNYPETEITYVILHEPKTEGQYLQILAEHPDRLGFGEYYVFDADGTFVREVGMTSGEIGQQIAASAYRLHFGSYGGLPIKLAYTVFGAALAFIIAAGLNIYFIKRREKGRDAPRLEAIWAGLAWGAPAMLSACLAVSLLFPSLHAYVVAIFWWSLTGGLVLSGIAAEKSLVAAVGRKVFSAFTALAIISHGVKYGGEYLSNPLYFAVALAALGLVGIVMLWDFRASPTRIDISRWVTMLRRERAL
ncbi:MAG: PepSY-associated TM helix domain-containing protein [Pseudomonadota bacterium]